MFLKDKLALKKIRVNSKLVAVKRNQIELLSETLVVLSRSKLDMLPEMLTAVSQPLRPKLSFRRALNVYSAWHERYVKFVENDMGARMNCDK